MLNIFLLFSDIEKTLTALDYVLSFYNAAGIILNKFCNFLLCVLNQAIIF